MAKEVFELLIGSAERSFLQVGVFVGGMLMIFGLVNYRTRGGFVRTLERSRKWQPLFGALLGLTPGCGGALFVMPLFVRGVVSFGTVVAALAATAGDSAFVLIATAPLYAAVCYSGCFAVGVLSGYAVDALGLGKGLACLETRHEEAVAEHEQIERETSAPHARPGEVLLTRELPHIGHEEGDAVDMAIHHRRKPRPVSLGHMITHHSYVVYWALIAVGLVLGVVLLFQIDVNRQLAIPYLGLAVGVGGTAASIFLMIAGRTFLRDDTLEEQEHKLYSLRETLVHNAGDTAFATTWVFVAYFVYELFVYALGGGDHLHGEEEMQRLMQAAGLTAVLVAIAQIGRQRRQRALCECHQPRRRRPVPPDRNEPAERSVGHGRHHYPGAHLRAAVVLRGCRRVDRQAFAHPRPVNEGGQECRMKKAR